MKKRSCKYAIVIPIYKEILNETENISIRQAFRIFSEYDIYLVAPQGLEINQYQVKVEYFPSKYFESIKAYNSLMLSVAFYERFAEYNYILIYQLDAFVFFDKLDYFCDLGYDYIGAPWLYGIYNYVSPLPRMCHVGNGGLSLRKTKSFIKLLKMKQDELIYFSANEDVFFSTTHVDWFCVAPIEIGLQFAFEREVEECFQRNSRSLPFGCHAWEKYNIKFWKKYIEGEGYRFSQYVEQQGNKDEMMKERYKQLHDIAYFWENEYDDNTAKKSICNFFGGADKEYIIFGAGYYGREIAKWFGEIGLLIKYFCDNNEDRKDQVINGCKIITVRELVDYKDKVNIIIATKYGEEIKNQLEQLGFIYKKNFLKFEDLVSVMRQAGVE